MSNFAKIKNLSNHNTRVNKIIINLDHLISIEARTELNEEHVKVHFPNDAEYRITLSNRGGIYIDKQDAMMIALKLGITL